jgi:hypothetical protein
VNVPRLVRLLADYSPQEDWYLGKPSIRAPLEILNRDKSAVSLLAARICKTCLKTSAIPSKSKSTRSSPGTCLLPSSVSQYIGLVDKDLKKEIHSN